MSIRKKYLSLKLNSIVYDVDGEDRKGNGKGVVTKISEEFISVKFQNKSLPMFMNKELFLYDRAGRKGSKRCYIENEDSLNYQKINGESI